MVEVRRDLELPTTVPLDPRHDHAERPQRQAQAKAEEGCKAVCEDLYLLLMNQKLAYLWPMKRLQTFLNPTRDEF